MKKILFSVFAIASLGFASSCSDNDNDGPDTTPEGTEVKKSGFITANETWDSDNVYILDGKVIVSEGVTLTIEAGTIIKGAEGREANASALVVDQGGKLMANGTPDKPIIFTSVLDNIKHGEKAGTNLTVEDMGLWGGVIVLGRAPISVSGDLETKQIEGIPGNESYGQYGGTNSADNSGSLKYISIRHGGILIGQDNEINGLTLGGVGTGTVIENIEVVANQDDGIEWFGGSVNATNLLVWACGDDGLDTDMSYSGTAKNALIIQGNESGSALELDGPEGSEATEDGFTLQDITINGNNKLTLIADLRDGLIANLNNIFVYNIAAGSSVKVNGEESLKELAADRIKFSKWEIVVPGTTTLTDLITGAGVNAPKFVTNAAVLTSASQATVGANVSVFGWTYAKSKSAF